MITLKQAIKRSKDKWERVINHYPNEFFMYDVGTPRCGFCKRHEIKPSGPFCAKTNCGACEIEPYIRDCSKNKYSVYQRFIKAFEKGKGADKMLLLAMEMYLAVCQVERDMV